MTSPINPTAEAGPTVEVAVDARNWLRRRIGSVAAAGGLTIAFGSGLALNAGAPPEVVIPLGLFGTAVMVGGAVLHRRSMVSSIDL